MRRRNESKFPYRAQVLDRSFGILDVLAESSVDLSLADLGEKLSLHKSTLYRLLRTLERHRFAEKDPGTGRYRLGSKLLELGARAVSRSMLVSVGRPYLEQLSTKTGETSHLGILSDGEVISIATVEGRHNLRVSAAVGSRAPAHCSSQGKAILAFLPEEEVDMVLRIHGLKSYTRNTITQSSRLKTELARIRLRGYSIDNQEFESWVRCIGAAVLDQSGRVVAALGIAGASLRVTRNRISAIAPLVTRAASELSASLGYQPSMVGSSNGHSLTAVRS